MGRRFSACGWLAVSLLAVMLTSQIAVGQTRSTATSDLDRWREREAAVLNVVQNVTDAVVAVTDDESVGSGVVVSKDGLVLTAGHVIMSGAKEFTIYFPDGRSAVARPLGKNLNQDAGMLQITDEGEWPYVDLSDGQSVQRGDWVIAIGHSGGFDLGRRPPVRVGRVQRVERDALTTDSPIIGGDSGGPLFNLQGQAIGIHSSIGESISENRHVSIRTFLRDWDRLKAGESWGNLPGTRPQSPETPPVEAESGGRNIPRSTPPQSTPPQNKPPENKPPGDTPPQSNDPRRGPNRRNSEGNQGKNSGSTEQSPIGSAVLGIEMDLNDSQAIIREIKPNSAAARVGLRPGDRVESFNGTAVGSPESLVLMIATKRAGDSVKLVVRRGADKLEYQIILGQLDPR